jgi:hypothetical protein
VRRSAGEVTSSGRRRAIQGTPRRINQRQEAARVGAGGAGPTATPTDRRSRAAAWEASTRCPKHEGCSRSTAQHSGRPSRTDMSISRIPGSRCAIVSSDELIASTCARTSRASRAGRPTSRVGSCSRPTTTVVPTARSASTRVRMDAPVDPVAPPERKRSFRPRQITARSGRSRSATGSWSRNTTAAGAPGRASGTNRAPAALATRPAQVRCGGVRNPTPSPEAKLSPSETCSGGVTGAPSFVRAGRKWPAL